jgi:hypothetical protein
MIKELLELQNNIKKELDKYYVHKGILIEFNYEKEFSLLNELIEDANKVGFWYYIYTKFFIPIPPISKGIRIDIVVLKTVGGKFYPYFEIVDNITAKDYKYPWWSIKVIFVASEETEKTIKFEEKYSLKLRKRYDEGFGPVLSDEIFLPLESFVEPKIVLI